MFKPNWLPFYGDISYRGPCNREIVDQIDFISWLQKELPEYYRLTFHPKVEGRRNFAQATIDKKTGSMKSGVSDVICIGSPMLVMEIKRKDEKKSTWRDGQLKFLEESQKAGAYVCLAFGFEGAKEAFAHWVTLQAKNDS